MTYYLTERQRSDLERLLVVGVLHRCHEEVTRDDESQPCDAEAVAIRLEPEAGTPYPVCALHTRDDMVALDAIIAEVPE